MRFFSIILARGGSKSIPKKNLIKVNHQPLIAYTIKQCIQAGINDIYTSSDSQEILDIAESYGSKPLLRPDEISTDKCTSESAWIDAINRIPDLDFNNDWIFAPQVTSPIREENDLRNAISMAKTCKWDSIFSAVNADEFLLWQKVEGFMKSTNHDYINRLRRQDIKEKTFLENGSFYLFKPSGIIKFNNRLHGKIGVCEMDRIKMFQIDDPKDILLAESVLSNLNIK